MCPTPGKGSNDEQAPPGLPAQPGNLLALNGGDHFTLPGSLIADSTSQAMRLYKVWVDASETLEEIEKQQLDYIRAGNVGPGSMEGIATNAATAANGGGALETPKPKRETPGGVKQKTTQQLAKSES